MWYTRGIYGVCKGHTWAKNRAYRGLARGLCGACAINCHTRLHLGFSAKPLIGESLGLETKSTETLGLVPVSYKILEVVSSRMKNFQTVSSRLLQFYSVSSRCRPDLDLLFSNIIKPKFNHFIH